MNMKRTTSFLICLFAFVASVLFVAGCRNARSNAAVAESSGETRPADEGITEEVKAKLKSISDEDSQKIEVETKAGTVVLSGIVSSQSTVDTAMNLAWSVEGVRDVQSEMIVVRQEGK